MEFNDTSSELGICQDARSKLGLAVDDTVTLPVSWITRSANNWSRRVNGWVWASTGTWEYDDSNWTNLPIATTDLVDQQQDYELPSVAQKIDRVEVKDDSGDWWKLGPFDKSQIDEAMSEYYETAGRPEFYDLVGRSLMLYPKVDTDDVTATDGLQVYFSRDISEFSVSDTSTEPGFVSSYHEIIPAGVAFDYASAHKLDDVRTDMRRLVFGVAGDPDNRGLKGELMEFYGYRHREMPPRIYPRDRTGI